MGPFKGYRGCISGPGLTITLHFCLTISGGHTRRQCATPTAMCTRASASKQIPELLSKLLRGGYTGVLSR